MTPAGTNRTSNEVFDIIIWKFKQTNEVVTVVTISLFGTVAVLSERYN